jgi:hypothetical protein
LDDAFFILKNKKFPHLLKELVLTFFNNMRIIGPKKRYIQHAKYLLGSEGEKIADGYIAAHQLSL